MTNKEIIYTHNNHNMRASIAVPYNIEPDRLQYDSKLYHVLSPYKRQINQQIDQINQQFEKRKPRYSLSLSQASAGSNNHHSLPNLYDSEIENEFLQFTMPTKQYQKNQGNKILPSSPLSFTLRTQSDNEQSYVNKNQRSQSNQSCSDDKLPQLAQSLSASQSRHLIANRVKQMTQTRYKYVKSQLIPKSEGVKRPSWTPSSNACNVYLTSQHTKSPSMNKTLNQSQQASVGPITQYGALTPPRIDPVLLQRKKPKFQHKIPLLNGELGAYL